MAEQKPAEEMTDEELMAAIAAEEEAAAGQPRDEHGKFVAQEPAAAEPEPEVEAEPEAAPKPEWFVREIDLGDGSGKQVFKGRTLDELADRLAEAQANATRKIRELAGQRKQEERENADNEFVLSQELLNKPSATLRRQFEEMVGMPIDAFKGKLQKVEAFEKAQSAEEASKEFVQAHEDYYASPGNGKRMSAYLNRMGLDWTVENMEKAYAELQADGLLAPKPAEGDAQPAPVAASAPRSVAPAAARRAASGLSARRSAPAPVVTQHTEEDLYKMPMEELEALAMKGSL